MESRVQVKDQISNQVLFECNVEEISIAYKKAAEYEEMGLDVVISAPSLTETLIKSLGATEEEMAQYKSSTEEEINAHNEDFGDEFGCAICPPKSS
jgi:hypothetical protein